MGSDASKLRVREGRWGVCSMSEESKIGLGRRGRACVEEGGGAELASAACSQGRRRTILAMDVYYAVLEVTTNARSA